MAFHALSIYLEKLPEGPKLIFIDELPWMDTAKSGFIPALENFWNSWAALRNDVKLIVCGSATSWIINNLIRSRGGLHNRLTRYFMVEPFTLAECEDYFQTFGFTYTRKQMVECYMVMGGIPFYMSMLDWSGLAFERVCFTHLKQIKKKLGISGVQTRICSWRSTKDVRGAQIDLLIDRKDETINVCEIKYANGLFEITKEYEAKLINKLDALQRETATRKSLMLTLVTSYGVKSNAHSGIVQAEVLIDDLFE